MNNIKVYLNTLRQKGYLAYEYNPFHNYQTEEDLYLYDNKYLIPKNCALNFKNGEILRSYIEKNSTKQWTDKNGIIIKDAIECDPNTMTLYASAGSLIDLDTDKLNFDLDHPVDIEVQPSYDGSVNLILNDDKNIPRLINSRFSVREKNTYEIVDRIGENDTNIYNSKTFDKDTSLYFQYETNPIIEYKGFINGNLLVGQYCFYLTYCDSDDNESDFIAESGLIPVFIGGDKEAFSINGGIKNELTEKGIRLKLTNIDKSYNYFKVYYVRYFADYQQNRVYECKKIYKKYPINSGTIYLLITGHEEAEDLDPNILNISRFNPKNVLTLAQCKNMLFFGNIVKNSDNYKELLDCALRIVPSIKVSTLNTLDYQYNSLKGEFGYYDSNNMYNNVGYFNEEYYRFGVVFIYLNGTLSNVYNTLGANLKEHDNNYLSYKENTLFQTVDNIYKKRKYIEIDDKGWIKNAGNFFENFDDTLNSKGVCKFDLGILNDNTILGINFYIPDDIKEFLKNELNIRGLFFVRQKCIPTILALCYILPMDETLKAPIIKIGADDSSEYLSECFVTLGREFKYKTNLLGKEFEKSEIKDDGLIRNEYENRLYHYKYSEDDPESAISLKAYAAICPDFLLNQPYYNLIFNGNKFVLKQITSKDSLSKSSNPRFYEEEDKKYLEGQITENIIISSVTEDVPTVALKNKVFKLTIGETEEAYKFEYAEINNGTYDAGDNDIEAINKATNIVRGKYSPYLAIYSGQRLQTGQLYNIYLYNPNSNYKLEFQNRMDSSEPFYAISNRYNFDTLYKNITCWRGDCYINLFTYRLNRNFNDPSLPNNDKIIDSNTWKDNYDAGDPTKWENISRSDLNAVQMGSWITLKIRSAINYALRSIDHSYVSEEALMGSPRSFYPVCQLTWRGNNKIPDSYLYNDAYRASLGFKCYFALLDINYIKDTFSNRILYSAIAIQDSFKNNYRDSLSTYFRDYSLEYGSIQKLVEFGGLLLVIFEHAIGIAIINERVLAGGGDGEPVFINTKNVLPEELTIITDTYGTLWPESIVKSEAGYVYGVDTIAKKIWRVKGQEIELLSDFKVNKFLVDNISLGERETSPIIGLKNVKTHYNNNKKDIMFTFYDDIYKDEEKVWNLCYNELLGEFVTFYSWIPSYSANIDTKFFSFDRESSKYLSLLNRCNYNINTNYGILLDSPVMENDLSPINIYYRSLGVSTTTIITEDGSILKTKSNPNFIPNVTFELLNDRERNNLYFDILKDENNPIEIIVFDNEKRLLTINVPAYLLVLKDNKKVEFRNYFNRNPIMFLCILPKVTEITNKYGLDPLYNFKAETVAITLNSILDNLELTNILQQHLYLTTDFYLHGQAGIFNVVEDLYPTHWYGKYHPFEFEFIVNDKIGQQKIFENLVIISNKAEPESFHFEVEGDNYEFSNDKRAMYFRQEATKELYLTLGSNILFNRDYKDIMADPYTYELYYRKKGSDYEGKYNKFDRVYPIYESGLVLQKKSSIFPLYYERVDTYNDIYYKYQLMHNSSGIYDFLNLSGSEISWNRDLNQFNVITHIKNSPIDLVGRLRGNSRYKEGKWNIQIPSIIFNLKNEETWPGSPPKPPIIINTLYVPTDLTNNNISADNLPNIYGRQKTSNIEDYVKIGLWTYRKEARIRDKWIKIRVRYSGKNLAVIHSLITLYNISYS